MSTERPKDWDRYLGPLLFAYREAPQASLGFSPFELLEGRTLRGPMSILKELWTSQRDESEVQSTYHYVIDLKERLEDTCKLAHENLRRAKVKQKHYYDKRSRECNFKVGDNVLLLLPTDNNKLLLQWKGPFPIIAKVGKTDYQIDLLGKVKTFHANLLKLYIHRDAQAKEQRKDSENTTIISVALMDTDEMHPNVDGELLISPSMKAKETIADVKVSEDLTYGQKSQVYSLLQQFPDVLTDMPGRTTISEHDIKLTTDEPVRLKPYPVPFALKDTVKDEISTMLKLGVIEPSESPYASPIVLVKKKDTSIRFCIDFRKLNHITVFDAEPIPNPEEIFASLSGDQYFSRLDLTKGYWQIPLSEESRQATAFITPRGLYQFRMMPFGLVNAPASFSRIMRRMLRGTENTDSFIDDILIHTPTWEEHLMALEELFFRLRAAGLTAKPSKCDIAFHSLDFLGHVVGKGKLKPQPDKLQKIQDAKRPETKKELRSFLGLAGYYRRFIPNFAAIAVPLTDLTKKKEPNQVRWGESQETSFNTLKEKLTTSPILQLPDCTQPFVLRTDASNTGLGAVLLQEKEDEGKFPVAYASRKLLTREKSYATIEKECLAVVWGIQKFEVYLYGREFTL